MDESKLKARAREFFTYGYHADYQTDFYVEMITTFARKVADDENRDLRERMERYERMMSEAMVIEFWDRDRTLRKSGCYDSSTGVEWTVENDPDDDEESIIYSSHETALEAFQALTKLQEKL